MGPHLLGLGALVTVPGAIQSLFPRARRSGGEFGIIWSKLGVSDGAVGVIVGELGQGQADTGSPTLSGRGVQPVGGGGCTVGRADPRLGASVVDGDANGLPAAPAPTGEPVQALHQSAAKSAVHKHAHPAHHPGSEHRTHGCAGEPPGSPGEHIGVGRSWGHD